MKVSLIIFTGRCNIDQDYYLSSKVIWDHAPMHEVYYDEHLLLPEDQRFINGSRVGNAISPQMSLRAPKVRGNP